MNPKSPMPAGPPRTQPPSFPSLPAKRHPLRSALSLVIIALGLGLALAASLGVVIWLIAAALHSASTA